MTIKAHFDGRTFVPDEPVDVAMDQPVTVNIPSPVEVKQLSDAEFELILAEMDADAVHCDHVVDWSRDSIYSGTLDDTR